MMHAAPNTCVDVRCMALECFYVTFHGVEAHAAMSPHKGKSAFDAALLSFQGIEFMREHVLEDSRMHYTVLDAGGPSNIVPGTAKAEYTLRSYSTDYLEKVIVPRFQDIIKGACLMTGTTCEGIHQHGQDHGHSHSQEKRKDRLLLHESFIHIYIHSFRSGTKRYENVPLSLFFLYNSSCRELGILQITGR